MNTDKGDASFAYWIWGIYLLAVSVWFVYLKQFVLLVFFLVFAFVLVVGIGHLFRARAKAMCDLATRWKFQYSAGNPRIWGGRRREPVHYPTGFTMRCYPLHLVSRIWNVVDGQRNGIRVLIFDSVVGKGWRVSRRRCCTFIATQTEENVLKNHRSQEEIAQSAGWTAVYRIPFFGGPPWTLSIARIEELLRNL